MMMTSLVMRPILLSCLVLAGLALGGGGLSGCASEPAPPNTEAPAEAHSAQQQERVIALGGSTAETVHALGAGSLLVARDVSALYPEAVQQLPSVGYFRQLSGEGLLAMRPTLVLADAAAGPPPALQQVREADVRLVVLPGGSTPDSVAAQIRAVAETLNRQDDGERLVETLRADLAQADSLVSVSAERPRVLFVLGQGGGTLSLAGTDTDADTFIRLAGGTNAFAPAEGYKPITSEAMVEAQPDVIFMLGRTAEAVGGAEAFAQRPDVTSTPAAQNDRILVLPDAALNFGPSLGERVLSFARQIHGTE